MGKMYIIGKNIKRIRLLRGLSQETLASDLQKSINFVSLVGYLKSHEDIKAT